MPKKLDRKIVVLIVILARILSAIFILINTFWGFVIFCIFDAIDSFFLFGIAKISREKYVVLDKYIDWIGYIAMMRVSYGTPYLIVLFPLFLFRLIGQFIFMNKGDERVFLLFPNFFDLSFFWFVALKAPDMSKYNSWFILLLVLAIIREFLLHLFWPILLKRFGYKNSFGERIAK